MNNDFLLKIKDMLIAERKTILDSFDTESQSEIDLDGDETDRIQGKIMLLLNNRLSTRNKQKLLKIKSALDKIDHNTYGVCEDCEGEIPEKRLEINPYFDICVSCAEIRETEERNRRL